MKSGQFYRGKIDGIQKRFESPNLDKIVPYEKLNELKDIDQIGVHPQFHRQSRALIITVVAPAVSLDGRRGGVTNHTVIYAYDAYKEHDDLKYPFPMDDFIAEVLAGKRRFKMPPTPEYPQGVDFAIIEPPPPIEWEVS